MTPTPVAIIGSGNIGTDLMVKVLRDTRFELVALVGIDPASDGLARARRLGVPTTSDGVEGLIALDGFERVEVVLDATSARAHVANAAALAGHGKKMVDLTPAALGPFVVPAAGMADHADAPEVNMVTCGGQATVPIVAAVAGVAPVLYAEIVASIASASAGPGTRANIDEFTATTARALEVVGGAAHGKAIIVLNPAEPPVMMRDTVMTLVGPGADTDAVVAAVVERVAEVAAYVPGYRLKQEVQLGEVAAADVATLVGERPDGEVLTQVSVFLEVEGAAHYLPAYAGNLDIMTSAAVQAAHVMSTGARAVAA